MYSPENLHFEFKQKVNKVDSLQNRNFFVEQIDHYLNEALNIFIEEVLKLAEADQNKIEYIGQLIKEEILTGTATALNYVFDLPSDYYRHLNSMSIEKECKSLISHYPVQHDDLNAFLSDPLYKPSLEWRETGYQLQGNKLIVWTNGEFDIDNVKITYVKKHPRIANPIQSRNGTYNLPDGTLAVQQGLLLDSRRQFNTITDIAALNVHIDIYDSNYQTKLNKLITNYVL